MKTKIVGFFICMLMIIAVFPVSGNISMDCNFEKISSGNILYVGGSGTGNYTSIQKAINDAEIGDTVFVYDDSSPYYTSARVRKSINLIGENKHTTVIRSIIDFVVNISAHDVLIKGFKIETGEKGIIVNSNYNVITENIFTNYDGIFIINSKFNIIQGNRMNTSRDSIHLDNSDENVIEKNEINSGRHAIWLNDANDNIITKNNISGKNTGILTFVGGERNTISQNHISNSEKGIWLMGDHNNIISDNYLSNNHDGIYLFGCYKTNISNNVIISNTYRGFVSIHCTYNYIFHNTFVDNKENAYFCLSFVSLWPLRQRSLNKWENNFWQEPQKAPHKIYGEVFYRKDFPLLKKEIEFNFTWINFDWHPAQEPYYF